MAQIVIRKLDGSVKQRLKRRAKRNSRTLEAEIKEILCCAAEEEANQTCGFGTEIASLFKGIGLKEDIPGLRGFTIEPINFDE